MFPDQYGFHQVQLHNEDVRKDYRHANGTVQRRVAWRAASDPSAPSGRDVAHSISSMIAAIRLRIRREPIGYADHAIESSKGL